MGPTHFESLLITWPLSPLSLPPYSQTNFSLDPQENMRNSEKNGPIRVNRIKSEKIFNIDYNNVIFDFFSI